MAPGPLECLSRAPCVPLFPLFPRLSLCAPSAHCALPARAHAHAQALDVFTLRNNLFMNSHKPSASASRCKPRPAPGPRRTFARNKGTGESAEKLEFMESGEDWSDGEEEEEGQELRSSSGRRAYVPTPRVEWDGNRQPFKLPLWTDDEGKLQPHRKSCHICTQCPASWRGNFTEPLACSRCPQIFRSRCLFHINGSDTVTESEQFIAEYQGKGWVCFVCCGQCACQNPKYGHLCPMDRHKRAGWVGVTGGGLVTDKQKQPRMRMRATRDAPRQDQATEEPSGAARPVATPDRLGAAVREGTPVPSLSKPPPPPLAPANVTPDARKRKAAVEPCAPTPAPAPAPAPALQCGAALVGRKVRAYWEAEQDWFSGTLSAFHKRSKQHKISYDDGDTELVTLPDATVQLWCVQHGVWSMELQE